MMQHLPEQINHCDVQLSENPASLLCTPLFTQCLKWWRLWPVSPSEWHVKACELLISFTLQDKRNERLTYKVTLRTISRRCSRMLSINTVNVKLNKQNVCAPPDKNNSGEAFSNCSVLNFTGAFWLVDVRCIKYCGSQNFFSSHV